MPGPALEVHGLRELRRNLRQLGDDATDLKDANAETAQVVASAAVARAPKRSGRLAASVKGNRAVGRATVKAGTARIAYAGPIHWGWPARHITGQPFVTDAAQDTEQTWLPAYEAAIAAVVERATHNT